MKQTFAISLVTAETNVHQLKNLSMFEKLFPVKAIQKHNLPVKIFGCSLNPYKIIHTSCISMGLKNWVVKSETNMMKTIDLNIPKISRTSYTLTTKLT